MTTLLLQKVHFPKNTYFSDLPLFKFSTNQKETTGTTYTITTDLNVNQCPLIEMILLSDDLIDNDKNFISYNGVQLTNQSTYFPTNLFLQLSCTIMQNLKEKINLAKAIIVLAYYYNLQTLDINEIVEQIKINIYNDERFANFKQNFSTLAEISDNDFEQIMTTLNVFLIEPYLQINEQTAEYRFLLNPDKINLGIITFSIMQQNKLLEDREILIPLPSKLHI